MTPKRGKSQFSQREALAKQYGWPAMTMTTMSGYRFPVPYAFSLRGFAERLPGGVQWLLTTAWLSGDRRARAVRERWISIPRETRREIAIEELCLAAGIEPGELVGLVVRTAWDLGLDVGYAVIGTERLRAPRGASRTLTCHDMARLRKKLRLAGRQFSQVLGVRSRTVRWWDAGIGDPQPQHCIVIELVNRYLDRNGVKAFRRLLGEPPRYGKRGRLAQRLAQRSLLQPQFAAAVVVKE